MIMRFLARVIAGLRRWALPIEIALCAAALLLAGWVGYRMCELSWQKERTDLIAAQAAAEKRAAQITERVITQYVDRVQVVRERGQTITREVTKYVPIAADAACSINRGFVRLHDAAATNMPASPASAADAAPSGVALSTVGATVAINYQQYHELAEQVIALQDLVRQQAGQQAERGDVDGLVSPVDPQP